MIRGLRWQRGPDLGGVVPGKVQGNVLRPYGYPVSTHVFARIGPADSGRAALAELVPQVTAGAPWIESPPSTLNISFTYSGLAALDLPEALLASFPDAFRQGMAARAATLGDTGKSDPSQWEEGLGTGDAHVLFTIHATSAEDERIALDRLHACLDAHGLHVGDFQVVGIGDGHGRIIAAVELRVDHV